MKFFRRTYSYCDLTIRILKYGYKAEWAYKSSFLIQLIAMAINNIMLLVVWVFFFAKFKQVNGWTFKDTQLLFTTHILTFVFTILLFGGALQITRSISEGDLDQYIILPRSVLWRCLIKGFSISILGDLVFALGMLAIVSVTQKWFYFLLIPLISALGAWGFLMITIAFQSLGFWFKRFERASWHYFWAVESPGLYPQTAIVGGLKVFLLTVVPSVWIITFPFYFIRDHAYKYLVLIIVFDLLMTLLATTLFRRGLRHYESGNLVNINN